jgi:thiol-disulfide isomerase/thioredoxin
MKLKLYVRSDCHLCVEMHRELLKIAERHPFDVEVVDIDADTALVALYGHKVPVLVGGDEEICHYFLDEQQLVEFLSRAP